MSCESGKAAETSGASVSAPRKWGGKISRKSPVRSRAFELSLTCTPRPAHIPPCGPISNMTFLASVSSSAKWDHRIYFADCVYILKLTVESAHHSIWHREDAHPEVFFFVKLCIYAKDSGATTTADKALTAATVGCSIGADAVPLSKSRNNPLVCLHFAKPVDCFPPLFFFYTG